MMHPLRTGTIGLALLSMLVAALMVSGAAHRMQSADSTALDAFVLAGGDLADLCDAPGGNGVGGQSDCPACHVAGTAEIPAPGLLPRKAGRIVKAAVSAPRESRAQRPVRDPGHAMRAPPLV
ncbi:MAG: hypothetical protein LW703_13835 [Rhodobacter sp.]|nr:hypothetical protein [Rhodobacter sp.]